MFLYSNLVTYLLTLFILAVPFLLCSLLIRLYVVVVAPDYLHVSLLWGIGADCLWSLLPASLVLLTPRMRPTLMLVLLCAWALTHWLDAQSLLALGVPADYRDFHYVLDPVFLKSTLANVQLSLLVVPLLGLGLLWWLFNRVLSRTLFGSVRPRLAFGFSGCLLLLLIMLPLGSVSDWRWQNSVGNQLLGARLDATRAAVGTTYTSSRHLLQQGPANAMTALPGRARNVLLIVLEGLPGAYLPQVSDASQQPVPVRLEHLGPWAERGWMVPQFINHTRQTLRGLYAILCADYPRLIGGTPKPLRMLEHPSNGEACLPEQLRRAGFHTAYLQAADLEFMSKGLVMPAIGYEQVEGKRSFQQALAVTNTGYSWGPTDTEFFAQVLPRLAEINAADKPWFVTLLTVGTHFPYGIEAAPGATAVDNKMRAVMAADESAAEFLQALEAAGVLDDTLVVVTSDEAHGIPGHSLGANWGLFFALAPDLEHRVANGLFGSVDVSRSIADYLGVEFAWGQSVFREAAPSRSLLFGYGGTVAMAREGLVHQCGRAGMEPDQHLPDHCNTSVPLAGALFSNEYRQLSKEDYTAQYRELLAEFKAIEGASAGAAEFSLPLLAAGKHRVPAGGKRSLGGGNYVDIPAGSQLQFVLAFAYHSSGNGAVSVTLVGRDAENQRDIMVPLVLPTLTDGERMTLTYRVPLSAGGERLQFRLALWSAAAAGELELHQLQLSVSPGDGPPEVQLQGKWEDLEFRLLDADTAPQMMPVYGLGEIITAHTHPGYFTSGWHKADPLDIWSKSSGVIHIPLPEANAESLQLIAESRVLLTEMDDSSTVEVFANNHPVGVWHYRTDENWGERRVLIEPELLALRDDVLVLEFRPRRTLRPAQGDSRELGMLLRKMVLRSGE